MKPLGEPRRVSHTISESRSLYQTPSVKRPNRNNGVLNRSRCASCQGRR